jgi:hypothetical protein
VDRKDIFKLAIGNASLHERSIVFRFQIGSQLWKIWTQRWKLIVLVKRFFREYKNVSQIISRLL